MSISTLTQRLTLHGLSQRSQQRQPGIVTAMDEAKVIMVDRDVLEERDHQTRLQVRGDQVSGQHGNPNSLEHLGAHRSDCTEATDAVEAKIRSGIGVTEVAKKGQLGEDVEQLVGTSLPWTGQRPLGEKLRRGDKAIALLVQTDPFNPGVVDTARADSTVDILRANTTFKVLTRTYIEVDRELGVSHTQPGQHRSHPAQPQLGASTNTQVHGHRTKLAAHRRSAISSRLEGAFGYRNQGQPRLGEFHLPGGPLEERDLESLFKLLDPLAKGGRGQAHHPRGRPKVEMPRRFEKAAK